MFPSAEVELNLKYGQFAKRPSMMKNQQLAIVAVSLLSIASLLQAAPPAALELEKGEHVAIVGNSLADRMQHDGYLEAFIYEAFPQEELTFRNLGFSGDELTLRLRAEGFGTPDEWLTKTKADVVFAFFGFNESFAGPAGLEKFKASLDAFIDDTRKQNYSGRGRRGVVLFSPIAQEMIPGPDSSALPPITPACSSMPPRWARLRRRMTFSLWICSPPPNSFTKRPGSR